jgi:putative intracellular protease/amidase
MSKMTSAELAKLCEGVPVKRALAKKTYRFELAGRSGGYARRLVRHEATCKYLKDAYRADKKRGGVCGAPMWTEAKPTTNKTRD